jgi:acyl transferase domain-containing protein
MISDIAYTRAVRREHLPHRSFSIVDNGEFIETAGGLKASQNAPTITMVFGGQGAQWPQMGRELLLSDHDFRDDILNMDHIMKGLKYPPTWNLMGMKNYCY